MKVSIIIPCYNQAHFLDDAIKSALEQTYKNTEIIVVDDGSPDNVKEVVSKYPTVIFIKKENGGLSSARNAGIEIATGTYILPLDADDKLHPTFIAETIGKDDIVSTGLRTFGNENRNWITDLIKPEYKDFYERNHINCCSLFKREVWEELGGYDEQMKDGFEDWDLWIRATKGGYSVTVVRKFLFFYRKHSVSMFKEAHKKRESIIAYMRGKYDKINIYKIWIGKNPLPEYFEKFTDTWSLISNANIVSIGNEYLKNVEHSPAVQWAIKNNNYAVLNHYIRYHLLCYRGGVYLDLDVEVIKDSPIWRDKLIHIGMEMPNWANNHLMIANEPSNNDFFKLCMACMDAMPYDQMQEVELNTGPRLVTRILQYLGYKPREIKQPFNLPLHPICVHPERVFSPHRWNQSFHKSEIKADTLAVHHFSHSWKKD